MDRFSKDVLFSVAVGPRAPASARRGLGEKLAASPMDARPVEACAYIPDSRLKEAS